MEYPISLQEMRERYLKLYSGALNDVMRFDYKCNAALPSDYAPLNPAWKLCGRAFTVKGAPDITTDGEFEMRARMLEALEPESVVVWDCTGDRVTAQWGEVMTMAAIKGGLPGSAGQRDPGYGSDLRPAVSGLPPVPDQRRNARPISGCDYYQKPVRIGEVTVNPGDWIFGDIDGAIAIPAAEAYTVLLKAEGILKREVGIRDMVNSGLRPTEVVAQGGYF